MSYLRALIVGGGEMSERALLLTGDIIAMNPAHYTIWCVAVILPIYPLVSLVFFVSVWLSLRRGNFVGRTELESYLH